MKDIKAERPKITEKDNLRLLFVTKWFLEFFRCTREVDKERIWDYGLITEVTDRSWFVWILRRMREAVEDKVMISSLVLITGSNLILIAKTMDRVTSWY